MSEKLKEPILRRPHIGKSQFHKENHPKENFPQFKQEKEVKYLTIFQLDHLKYLKQKHYEKGRNGQMEILGD